MNIEGRNVIMPQNYLDPVTYIPIHAIGNAGHKDCQQGVIISLELSTVRVLYSKTRIVQSTNPGYLVWG